MDMADFETDFRSDKRLLGLKLESFIENRDLQDFVKETYGWGKNTLALISDGENAPNEESFGKFLQLDVLKDRLDQEYGVPVEFETTRFEVLRWISGDDRKVVDQFIDGNRSAIAHDLDGAPVMLASSLFNLNYTLERAPGLKVQTIKEIHG